MIVSSLILFELLEPSTGMDPLSKRLMWRVITQLGKDKAILVTTHYMDECEALCSRIGIMNDGRLVCIGSSQHLKSRFATGYPFPSLSYYYHFFDENEDIHCK